MKATDGAMKFRKKPIVVEAVQYTAAIASSGWSQTATPEWLDAAYDAGLIDNYGIKATGEHWIEIKTPEGVMRADAGDWIIRGVQGEIYPCKPGIFVATYEAVPRAEGPREGGTVYLDDEPNFFPQAQAAALEFLREHEPYFLPKDIGPEAHLTAHVFYELHKKGLTTWDVGERIRIALTDAGAFALQRVGKSEGERR